MFVAFTVNSYFEKLVMCDDQVILENTYFPILSIICPVPDTQLCTQVLLSLSSCCLEKNHIELIKKL